MSKGQASPSSLLPEGLPGLDPRWSRLVTTPAIDGNPTWHLLDNQVVDPTTTLLCVHGNPTWSYLWRDLISLAPDDVRVIAVDLLEMGYSERSGVRRRLAQRIDDLAALTDELGLSGQIVTVAHDWGGPISLGWAERHSDQLAGIVLMNTAVNQPVGSPAPSLIRMVSQPWILRNVCEMTPMFIRAAMALSSPRPARSVRQAYESPYSSPSRREGIAAFVEDIPLGTDHPTHEVLEGVASGLEELSDVPALLLWGSGDPIFTDIHLRDLLERLPSAEVHRFTGSNHLLPEDSDIASVLYPWIEQLGEERVISRQDHAGEPLWGAVERRAECGDRAIVEMGFEGEVASVTFGDLNSAVMSTAAYLVELGVSKGDRVALLIPPGIDLAISVLATWRIGGVVVLADAGLGVRGMGRALMSADPSYLIGIPKALAAARMFRWPGIRISTCLLSETSERVLGVAATLSEMREVGDGAHLPEGPSSSDLAAVGFTSGATGPAKGVLYRHGQLQAQRDSIIELYNISDEDSLVAAFGPFALMGTFMGIPSVVPHMEVTSPGSLTAQALHDAIAALDATLVFASPAALRNVVATSTCVSCGITDEMLSSMDGVRLLLSAGAPVPLRVLQEASGLMVNAQAHTPYGMTEVMPVADIELSQIEDAGVGGGVCVGQPVSGVEVAISHLDDLGKPVGLLTVEPGVVGEVCIRARHMREGYDKLWLTDHKASSPHGWHRSGDVGYIDKEGRLWIQGRVAHLVITASGPVTPVGIEQAVIEVPDISDAAVVGVGPKGTQQIVLVVVKEPASSQSGIADIDLASRVRAVVIDVDVAAVLTVPSIPVDKRHNSKIDRTKIAKWAERVLAGGRVGSI